MSDENEFFPPRRRPQAWLPTTPTDIAQWQYSSNSGVTWVAAITPVNHTAGGLAVKRWRTTFTVQQGFGGVWQITLSGDKYDTGVAIPEGTLWMDGVQIAANTLTTVIFTSANIAVVPGSHTLEWREGQTVAGITRPVFDAIYTAVN